MNQLMAKPERETGFSLAEALIVLAIIAIITAGVLPSFNHLLQKLRMDMISRDLIEVLALARIESIKHGKRVTLRNLDGNWKTGWMLFVDNNNNCIFDDDEKQLVIRSEMANDNISVTGNKTVKDYISYLPSGQTHLESNAFQAGTITICHKNTDIAGRRIILSRGGRIRMEQLPANSATCKTTS